MASLRTGRAAVRALLWIGVAISVVARAAAAPSQSQIDAEARDKAEGAPVGYGVMLDAGSTGSRVHVYRWVWRGGSLPDVTDDFFHKVKPGLSSHQDANEGGASLQPLLDFAIQHIPEAAIKDTWVRLFATAGLRLLPVPPEPEERQEALLGAVRKTLNASPFIFKEEWVAIASGLDEAVDAWVTANYILETAANVPASETVGTLDLGGGSVQITCRPGEHGDELPAGQRVDFSLGSADISLYAHSHLAYGLNEMRKRVDASIVPDGLAAPPAKPFAHPCLLKGANTTVDGVLLTGTSDFDACLKLHSSLAHSCDDRHDDCHPLNKIPPPKTGGKFLAFSYFYDVLTEFLPDDDTPTVAEIRAAARRVCSSSFAEIHALHAATYDPLEPEHLLRACQDLTYIVELLHHYLGFAEDEERIQLVKQVRGKEMSWTLGASLRMLNAASKPANAEL